MVLCSAFVCFFTGEISSPHFNLIPLRSEWSQVSAFLKTHGFHLKFCQSIKCLWQFHLPLRRINVPLCSGVRQISLWPPKGLFASTSQFVFWAQTREGFHRGVYRSRCILLFESLLKEEQNGVEKLSLLPTHLWEANEKRREMKKKMETQTTALLLTRTYPERQVGFLSTLQICVS